MEKNPRKKPELDIKPPKSYLDSLAGFADLLGTIKEAERAASELTREVRENKMPSAGANPAEGDSVAPDPIPEAAAAPVSEPAEPEPDTETLLARLDELVGLENIKGSVRSLINLVKVRRLREEAGLPVPPMSLHMVFLGNPGTGKTTVARILGGLLRSIGVLPRGHLIETDRSGLVAGYVGQTAMKTAEVVDKALGGILFIDEAYALAPKNADNDFGREAVETLLKLMEDHRDALVVIVAGYSAEMDRFIGSNPGLQSRFNRYFYFEDYGADELNAIFQGLLERNQYALAPDAAAFARDLFERMYASRGGNFGNARDVRNLFENAVSVHADRVAAFAEPPTTAQLREIVAADLETAAAM